MKISKYIIFSYLQENNEKPLFKRKVICVKDTYHKKIGKLWF